MFDMLQDFAAKLWVLTHMDYSSQRLLRGIGPNGGWNILHTLPIIEKIRPWPHRESQYDSCKGPLENSCSKAYR